MRHRLMFSSPLAMALFLALVPTAMASTTWYVDGVNGNDSDDCRTAQTACKTIGRAIALATSGDSLSIAAATYQENLTIPVSLNMVGSGAMTTIVDGGGISRVVSIVNPSLSVTISRLTLRHGLGTIGGGIYNVGTLTVSSSTVSGNTAQGSIMAHLAASGGGIFSRGSATIRNSTLTGNLAKCSSQISCFGGGVFNNGVMTIVNSTISGNTSNDGGGIFEDGASLNISNTTLSANFAIATRGGGIDNNLGSVTLQNSIVANDTGGDCAGGIVDSNGYNLNGDDTCNFNSTGDLNNTDPKLGPVQNNGGPTQTQALLSGSPAIDAGNPSGCTDSQGHLLKTDQRGAPRPDKEDSGGCDMGAYERQRD